jgi:rubrerythrin
VNAPSEEFLRFLAHACELEQEAQDRYAELADNLATHNNEEAAAFFARMAEEASQHLAEVSLHAAGYELPDLAAWEYDWPGAEAPETASYEALHYRMSLREAMQLALAQERAAEIFYRRYAEGTGCDATRSVARDFADEEAAHVEQLELRLQALPAVSELGREDDDPPNQPD